MNPWLARGLGCFQRRFLTSLEERSNTSASPMLVQHSGIMLLPQRVCTQNILDRTTYFFFPLCLLKNFHILLPVFNTRPKNANTMLQLSNLDLRFKFFTDPMHGRRFFFKINHLKEQLEISCMKEKPTLSITYL